MSASHPQLRQRRSGFAHPSRHMVNIMVSDGENSWTSQDVVSECVLLTADEEVRLCNEIHRLVSRYRPIDHGAANLLDGYVSER